MGLLGKEDVVVSGGDITDIGGMLQPMEASLYDKDGSGNVDDIATVVDPGGQVNVGVTYDIIIPGYSQSTTKYTYQGNSRFVYRRTN